MAEDPYRDQLEAAHQRIAALERELAEARGEGALERRLPAALAGQLDDGERLLWHGQPERRGLLLNRFNLRGAVLWLLGLFWFSVLTLRGMPRVLLMTGGGLLGLGGLLLVHRTARALRRARATHYALTDRRVLVLQRGRRVRSLHLADISEPVLELHSGDRGRIRLAHGDDHDAALDRVADAPRVFRLLTAAIHQQREE
jgi:hypothetical protein